MDKSNFYTVLFLCIVFSSDVLSKKTGRHNSVEEGKIVGGYNTTIQKVPYQVYLLLQKGNDYFQCGGSILSKRHVLTAAHCLTGIQKVFVRAGSSDSDSGGTMYTTTTYTVHPQYNTKTSDYDVAIVKLDQDMKIDGVNTRATKLTAAGTSVAAGTTILVTGWGTTSENGDSSRQLMAVKVTAMAYATCKKSYSSFTERMFCAGVTGGGKDACQGDSGGPAVVDSTGVQVGIVSFGVGCARPNYPGVYSNIASFRSWIQQNSGV